MSEAVVRPPSHPKINAYDTAVKYAKGVLTGEIVAGKLVKLACKRFIQDLKLGSARGLTFDKMRAQHVVDFFGLLRHSKGEWGKNGGEVFVLQPWQVFILANLFGWLRADGTRRFREAHIEIARKNGKSTFLAGIALYMLLADDEPGAEVYSAATTRDQAKIVFTEACNMRKKSPFLASRIGAVRNNLNVLATNSKFEPLSSDFNTLDGLNSHGIVIDELHRHPTRHLYDVLFESTASRTQPLTVSITTAGFNRDGICFAQRKIAENILVGNVTAADGDSMFAYIACIDEPDSEGKNGDSWNDEKCWAKANPNLGVSVKLDKLREAARKADVDPTALNSFLCKHLNVWTSQEIRWMPPDKWAKCNAAGPLVSPKQLREIALKHLEGRVCIGGLDLSSKLDLTSFVLLFPPVEALTEKRALPQTPEDIRWRRPPVMEDVVVREADPKWSVLVWFWVPKECIPERVKKDRVQYDVWEREGYLQTTPGNSINHETLYNFIKSLRDKFRFTEIAFDSWNAQWISKKLLEDGFKPEEARMGYQTLSEPMKELMGLVLEKKLEHFADPILAWNAGNVAATTDATGSIKPDKDKSKEKIDGIVALIMAMSRVCANPALVQTDSVYNHRGIVFI